MLYATNAMKHWAICVFFLAAAAAFCADAPLPEGKGKDVVVNACTSCHSADRITALRLSEEGWRSTIRQMIENGASLNRGRHQSDPCVSGREFWRAGRRQYRRRSPNACEHPCGRCA